MTELILQTKLFIPPIRSEVVRRSRLIAKLNDGLNAKLTLVSAPAGFGKSTLVIDWLKHLPSSTDMNESLAPDFCWLSLDDADNHPGRFLTYFITALQTIEEMWGAKALSLLELPQPLPITQVITLLVNDLAFADLRSPIILVLDDYHLISNQEIHRALSYLLNNAPPNLHLVITTRSDPPLPLSQMRVRGEMTEIREADLRFTEEETAVFLNRLQGVGLAADSITTLASRTEGWIAALQLAALALRGHDSGQQATFVASFGGAHAHVVDYLMDEVWHRQSEDVQNFWLETSVLDRLSGSLCDAVLGRNDSKLILQRLYRENLFLVPLDNKHQWYRYHHLFADMLGKRAAELDEAMIRQLHQRAAVWYEQYQHLPQAVHHILAAGDLAEATRLIVLAAEEALRQGDLIAIQRWLEALPVDHVRSHYRLALVKAWVSYLGFQIETATDYLAAVQETWPDTVEPEQQVSLLSLQAFIAILQGDISTGIALGQEALTIAPVVDYSQRELILFNLMQAQAAAGDIEAAVQSGFTALRLGLETENAFLAANILEGLLQLLIMQGKLREAIRLGEEVVDRFLDQWNNPLPLAGPLHIALGQVYYERGDVDRAYDLVQQGINLGRQMDATLTVLNGKLHLARIQQLRGKEDLALALVGEVRRKSQLPQLRLIAAALEAEINLSHDNVDASLTWAGGAEIPSLETPRPQFEMVYLVYARCLLAGRAWSKADTLLASLAGRAREQGRFGSLLPILVAQSISRDAQGKRSAAVEGLREAVLIASPEGHKRPFLEVLPQLVSLLQIIRPFAPGFVGDLLSHTEPATVPIAQSILPEPLNEREIEILRLIDAGHSNPEIADELYLSVNTVKWYVKGIFQKLDVSGRKEAAARARDLGLLKL